MAYQVFLRKYKIVINKPIFAVTVNTFTFLGKMVICIGKYGEFFGMFFSSVPLVRRLRKGLRPFPHLFFVFGCAVALTKSNRLAEFI